MGFESENSALESVDDNGAIANDESSDSVGDSVSKAQNNFPCAVENDKQLRYDVTRKAVEDTELVSSAPVMVSKSSCSGSPSLSARTVAKGRGLRKWRRIKREVSKHGSVNDDSIKYLKRGLSNAAVRQGNMMHFSAEMIQKSEGSVSSIMRNQDLVVEGFGSFGDSGPASGPLYAFGRDSENSKDQSSKSSTVTSVPKTRYAGHLRDKNRMGSLSGKNIGSSIQKVQHGKIQTETSKKPRGERVKIEKQNSHSSMESDSRSSTFVFMQGPSSVTSNSRQNGTSNNYGGQTSNEGIERQFTEELRTGYGRNINGDLEDAAGSSCGVKEEIDEEEECSTDQDPLAESVHKLQSLQEVLEKEVQKFKDIEREDIIVVDSSQDSCLPSELISVGFDVPEPSSSDGHHSLHALESEIISLKENVHLMENKLDKTTNMLKVKESEIAELEAKISGRSLKEETGSAMELHLDLQTELEALFRQKIETEVEYLALSRASRHVRVSSVDETSLLEEQKKLAFEQSRMLNKLGNAESKVVKLKTEAEQLENHCADIVSADETLKLQNSVCKYTSCFFIQLILLVVIIGLLILQFSPHSTGIVPT